MVGDEISRPIRKSHLLLVEDKDCVGFFRALVRAYRITQVDVRCYEGKSNFRDHMPLIQKADGFIDLVGLGIVRDADDDPLRAFESVTSVLAKCSLPRPVGFGDIAEGPPKVMVMIIPNDRDSGDFENVLLPCVERDPVSPCIDAYFECIASLNIPSPCDLDKAKVLAYLASREEYVRDFGIAAEKGYWDWASPELSWIVARIRDFVS